MEITDYEFYKLMGICVSCTTERAAPGRVRCMNCLENSMESSRRYLAKETKEEREKRLEKNREYQRNRRREMKEGGLCIDCGRKQGLNSSVYCIDCRIKNQRRNEKRRQGIGRNERRAYGQCYFCGEPIGKNGSLCDTCYDRVCANLPRKMNQGLYTIRKNQNKVLFKN